MQVHSTKEIFVYLNGEETPVDPFDPLLELLLSTATCLGGIDLCLEIFADDTSEGLEIIKKIKNETEPVNHPKKLDVETLRVRCGGQDFQVNPSHELVDRLLALTKNLSARLLMIQLPISEASHDLVRQLQPF